MCAAGTQNHVLSSGFGSDVDEDEEEQILQVISIISQADGEPRDPNSAMGLVSKLLVAAEVGHWHTLGHSACHASTHARDCSLAR